MKPLARASIGWSSSHGSVYTLPDNVEHVTARANGAATVYLFGNALNNTLIGRSNGATYLDGGAGADTLIGGRASDTYIVDNAGDTVVEDPLGAGVDTVQSSVSYTLGQHLENLQLTGSAAINGTGNTLNNQLDGSTNSAANVLAGGAGNDTYRLGAGDTVLEQVDAGTDTVIVVAGPAGTYSIDAFANVETLVLGDALNASHLTGNDADNRLQGNASANVLSGGAGNDQLIGNAQGDTLLGGAGDDTLGWRGR